MMSTKYAREINSVGLNILKHIRIGYNRFVGDKIVKALSFDRYKAMI